MFFAQQVCKLWISLPQDVTDLKWLKLIEYINGRKKSSGAVEHQDAISGAGIPWAAVTEGW